MYFWTTLEDYINIPSSFCTSVTWSQTILSNSEFINDWQLYITMLIGIACLVFTTVLVKISIIVKYVFGSLQINLAIYLTLTILPVVCLIFKTGNYEEMECSARHVSNNLSVPDCWRQNPVLSEILNVSSSTRSGILWQVSISATVCIFYLLLVETFFDSIYQAIWKPFRTYTKKNIDNKINVIK